MGDPLFSGSGATSLGVELPDIKDIRGKRDVLRAADLCLSVKREVEERGAALALWDCTGHSALSRAGDKCSTRPRGLLSSPVMTLLRGPFKDPRKQGAQCQPRICGIQVLYNINIRTVQEYISKDKTGRRVFNITLSTNKTSSGGTWSSRDVGCKSLRDTLLLRQLGGYALWDCRILATGRER